MTEDPAFTELIEPYRRELHLHCYRMLGSLTDAEDVLQETLLAAWRGLDGFERRSSVRTWLYRIATNRCLNAIRDRARRPPPAPEPPFDPPPPTRWSDVTWLQPYPDPAEGIAARETVELAFVGGLQRLPPRQAATLLLRDVLEFPAGEVADLLGVTETAVKGMLQRARSALNRDRPSAEASGRADEVAQRFAAAFADRDLDQLLALLTDDAWLAMPPAPHVYDGREAIAAFLTASGTWDRSVPLRLVPTRANNQPAHLCHLGGAPAGILVLTLGDGAVAGVTRFLDDRLFGYFAPPALLTRPGGSPPGPGRAPRGA